MKRINNLYSQIISIENLRLADQKACKGKSEQYGVQVHKRQAETNLLLLHESLLNKTYKTSDYKTFKVYEPKEREVFRLPYFPDRIAHHAVMNVLEPIFVRNFTADTYSCIKKKGIHAAANKVIEILQNEKPEYCLKLDIKKFYPSVDHSILKKLLRRKFKDNDLLWLIDEIIDSAPGLPIGNYLSQYLANFYLSGFDHWIKETKRVKHYFRYADDLVIFSNSKEELHQLLYDIKQYLKTELNLTVKQNYQVFPIAARGVDFLGYVFYHTHVRLRKTIKKRFAKKMTRYVTVETVASYLGWAKHANTKHLIKKIVNYDSNKIIQRLRSRKLKAKKLYRREDCHEKTDWQKNNHRGLRVPTVKVFGQPVRPSNHL